MRVTHRSSLAIVIFSMAFLQSCGSDSGSNGQNELLRPEKSWGQAGLVEIQDGHASNAQVVLFDDGSAMAVWHGNDSVQGPRRVYASRFTPGGSWSAPRAIDAGRGEPLLPRLAVDADGDVVVVWAALDANGSDQHVYANTYLHDAGWGTAQALQMSGTQEQPQVAMNDSGTALAVWQEMDEASVKSVVSSRYTTATGWESPVTIGQAEDLLTVPAVGIDKAGSGIASWLDRPPEGSIDLVASRFTDGVGWSATEAVESLDGAASAFAIALNAAGNGLATWWQSDGDGHGLYSSRFDPVSGWSAAEEIGPSDGNPGRLALALAPDDNAIVVWEQDTEESQEIYAAHRQPDGAWGDPQRLDSLEGFASEPVVAIDADGDAVAVWLQYDGRTDSVYAAQFNPQTGWGPQLILETVSGPPSRWFEARSPAVGVNPNGDALVVWTQFDGENYSIYGTTFNSWN